MKILEICPFSEGGCGVWARAREESIRLSKKGYEVRVFSGNFVKGTDKITKENDKIGKVVIRRFKTMKLGGESFLRFDFEKEAMQYKPDVIIVHNYRHLHTTKGLKIAKKLRESGQNCKIFLVTHAPFVEGNVTRTAMQTAIVKLYDFFVGRATINKFDKILAISKWEVPNLLKIGAKKEKIEYIPNGIPQEFFTQKEEKEENKVLFLGRISIKKKLDTLIDAMRYVEDKKIKLEIVGPKEKEYHSFLEKKIKENDLEKRIEFKDPIYNLKQKIKKIDSCKVFVLPSRVEGMPQALVEAMARKKIAIGSNSIAIRDLIKDGVNGFLFEFDNPKSLAKKIDFAIKKDNKGIKINARKSVEQFSWDKVVKKIENLIR